MDDLSRNRRTYSRGIPAVNTAIRPSASLGTCLNDYEVCRYQWLENAADVYSLEIIIRLPAEHLPCHTCSARGWWARHSRKAAERCSVMFVRNSGRPSMIRLIFRSVSLPSVTRSFLSVIHVFHACVSSTTVSCISTQFFTFVPFFRRERLETGALFSRTSRGKRDNRQPVTFLCFRNIDMTHGYQSRILV